MHSIGHYISYQDAIKYRMDHGQISASNEILTNDVISIYYCSWSIYLTPQSLCSLIFGQETEKNRETLHRMVKNGNSEQSILSCNAVRALTCAGAFNILSGNNK